MIHSRLLDLCRCQTTEKKSETKILINLKKTNVGLTLLASHMSVVQVDMSEQTMHVVAFGVEIALQSKDDSQPFDVSRSLSN